MAKTIALFLLPAFFVVSCAWAALGIVPPVDPPKSQLQQLQRTFSLLETSTPKKRNTVRVLFYGQSITQFSWWLSVANFLSAHYPSANLVIANLAIGGHTVDDLIKTADADVYPFQPDLIIFQAYGSETNYERFLSRIRERTCSDVIIQADHRASWDNQPGPPKPISELQITDPDWHSEVYLRGAAARWGGCFADVRTIWNEYLLTNHVQWTNMLIDTVHPNPDGNALLAAIMIPYVTYRDDLALADPYNGFGVHTVEIPEAAGWTNGVLHLAFSGSRVDVVMGQGASARVSAIIDHQRPSQFPSDWAFSQVSYRGLPPAPAILRLIPGTNLVEEPWTLTVTQTNRDRSFAFHLTGGVTGDDGDGTNTLFFSSKSGRVSIDPADWNLATPLVGTSIYWNAIRLHADAFTASPPPTAAVENNVTVAGNLPDGPHELILRAVGGQAPAIRAIRYYSPAERARASESLPRFEIAPGTTNIFQLRCPWLPAWVPEMGIPNADSIQWEALPGNMVLDHQTEVFGASSDALRALFRLRLN